MRSATARASDSVLSGSIVPSATGTPAATASRRAEVFSPRARCTTPGGPTNASPAAATASAKSAFSLRKP